jgi:hypothetical protein
MFSNRLQLRRWAARVLLVWLFGVVGGVANACWAEGIEHAGAAHSHVTAAATGDGAMDECAPHSEAQHDGKQAPSGDGEPHARSNCKTYCDALTISITPLKTALDNTPVHAIAASTLAPAAPLVSAAPTPLMRPGRGVGQDIPILFAFLRLAL